MRSEAVRTALEVEGLSLGRRQDMVIDHIGIVVRSLEGTRVTVPPETGQAFCNNKVAFQFAANNLTFESIDTTRKEAWREPV